MKRLPDFLIIGAMKAGTTSLFRYLARHPELSPAARKEPSFFTKKGFHKGLEWYQSLFPENDNLKFEASTNYAKYPYFANVPERIYQTIPEVRLIYIVRHPVKRCISQLHHNIVRDPSRAELKYESIDFWKKGGRHIVNVSKYHMQISRYLQWFDLSKILLLKFEDLIAHPAIVLNHVLEFLEMPGDYYSEKMTFRRHNKKNTTHRVQFPAVHYVLRRASQAGMFPPAHKLLETPVPRPVLPLHVRQYIWDQVKSDLRQFEGLFGHRLKYVPPA